MHIDKCNKSFYRFLRKSVWFSWFVPLTLILLLVTATDASGQVWKKSSQNPKCKNIYNPT